MKQKAQLGRGIKAERGVAPPSGWGREHTQLTQPASSEIAVAGRAGLIIQAKMLIDAAGAPADTPGAIRPARSMCYERGAAGWKHRATPLTTSRYRLEDG
jgi:hypothetical protein